MKLSISKTFKLGPINLTVSRTGLSGSIGIPGLRVGLNSKGKASLRAGIPGVPGLSFNKSKKVI